MHLTTRPAAVAQRRTFCNSFRTLPSGGRSSRTMFPLFLEEELRRRLAVGAAGGDQTGHRLLGRGEAGQGRAVSGPAGASVAASSRSQTCRFGRARSVVSAGGRALCKKRRATSVPPGRTAWDPAPRAISHVASLGYAASIAAVWRYRLARRTGLVRCCRRHRESRLPVVPARRSGTQEADSWLTSGSSPASSTCA